MADDAVKKKRTGAVLMIISLCSSGCGRTEGVGSARADEKAAAAQAIVGPNGATIEVRGGRVRIPKDALTKATTVRVISDALRKGETAAIRFEPAGLLFRRPLAIELRHGERGGEVACLSARGRGLAEPFEGLAVEHAARIVALALPARCAVHTARHTRTVQQARARERSVVDRLAEVGGWRDGDPRCDPTEIVRPNARILPRASEGRGGCPPSMAPIPHAGTCIDRWEAYLVEDLHDGTERAWSSYINPGDLSVRAKSAARAIPQAYVSRDQAAAACSAAKKRLCTDEEWIAACRGSKGTSYPYGDEEHLGTCNDHRDAHAAITWFRETDASPFSELDHPCIDQQAATLLSAGAKPECKTDGDVFDMVGNLHEWTAASDGRMRGGFFGDTRLNGSGCAYVTTAHGSDYWDYSTGFRCCASPGP